MAQKKILFYNCPEMNVVNVNTVKSFLFDGLVIRIVDIVAVGTNYFTPQRKLCKTCSYIRLLQVIYMTPFVLLL